MLADHVIATLGGDEIAVPVKVVDDDLNELYLRVLCQDLIQYLR